MNYCFNYTRDKGICDDTTYPDTQVVCNATNLRYSNFNVKVRELFPKCLVNIKTEFLDIGNPQRVQQLAKLNDPLLTFDSNLIPL